jgi:hypothetical protein
MSTGETLAAPESPTNNANYGGLDPENEDNLSVLNYVSDDGLRSDATDRRKILDDASGRYYPTLDEAGMSWASCRPSIRDTIGLTMCCC